MAVLVTWSNLAARTNIVFKWICTLTQPCLRIDVGSSNMSSLMQALHFWGPLLWKLEYLVAIKLRWTKHNLNAMYDHMFIAHHACMHIAHTYLTVRLKQ